MMLTSSYLKLLPPVTQAIPTPHIFVLFISFRPMYPIKRMSSVNGMRLLTLSVIGWLTISVLPSCQPDDDQSGWEIELFTPLIRTSLDITDLINDTLIDTEPDSSLKVVYISDLYDLSVDTLVGFNDTSVTKSYKLDSISLFDQTITYPVSLGQIAQNAGTIGQIIISQNGNTVAIPGIPAISSGVLPINADSLFESITLITGSLDIEIQNGLPIDITNLVLEIRNASNNALIASATFPLIPAGGTSSQTIPLDGKTIEGDLNGQIISMSSPGSGGNPVLVDTSDALLTTLTVYDLHPSSATAIFPAQDLVNKEQETAFKFKNIKLTEAQVRSGQINVAVYSTLQDSVYFTYKLPSATLGGVEFEVYTVLPPAQPGGVSSFVQSYDMDGYQLALTGANQDTFNTIYNTIRASVDSTGQIKTISLDDSVYTSLEFVDIVPEYARGYIGQDTVSAGPSSEFLEVFNRISGGTLDVDKVSISVEVENKIGADAQIVINDLTAVNTRTNNQVTLTGAPVSTPIFIQRATDNNGSLPINSTQTQVLIDETNSNATSFIGNLPDRIDYALTLNTNPNGNVSNYNDFIYADNLLEIDLNVEMPLSIIANDLTLVDTADISLGDTDLSKIKDGTLTLISDNGFPFDATIQMYTLAKNGTVTDSLFVNTFIAAAPVDANNRVYEKRRSKLYAPIDEARVARLQNAKKLRIITRFDTNPQNTYLKIYSDYTIDFILTGDFNYLTQ